MSVMNLNGLPERENLIKSLSMSLKRKQSEIAFSDDIKTLNGVSAIHHVQTNMTWLIPDLTGELLSSFNPPKIRTNIQEIDLTQFNIDRGNFHQQPQYDFSTGFTLQNGLETVCYQGGEYRSIGAFPVFVAAGSSPEDNSMISIFRAVEPKNNRLKVIYVEKAYSIRDFLEIKALGFNTILHYLHFDDFDSKVKTIVDNAALAGINLILNVEKVEQQKLSSFISTYEKINIVTGFYLYDEPGLRGISVSNQTDRINSVRALTGKPLSCGDVFSLTTANRHPDLYDMIFAIAYAGDGDSERYALGKFRNYFCTAKAKMTKAKVIPCVGLFKHSGMYSDNETLINSTCKTYGSVMGGDYCAFVWDGDGDPSITGNIRGTDSFKLTAIALNRMDSDALLSDSIVLGGVSKDSSVYAGVVSDLISQYMIPEIGMESIYGARNMWPMTLVHGETASSRIYSTEDVGFVTGLCVKGKDGFFPFSKKMSKYLTFGMAFSHLTEKLDGTFSIKKTMDGGVTYQDVKSYSLDGNIEIYETIEVNGGNISFFTSRSGNGNSFYRSSLMGMIHITNW